MKNRKSKNMLIVAVSLIGLSGCATNDYTTVETYRNGMIDEMEKITGEKMLPEGKIFLENTYPNVMGEYIEPLFGYIELKTEAMLEKTEIKEVDNAKAKAMYDEQMEEFATEFEKGIIDGFESETNVTPEIEEIQAVAELYGNVLEEMNNNPEIKSLYKKIIDEQISEVDDMIAKVKTEYPELEKELANYLGLESLSADEIKKATKELIDNYYKENEEEMIDDVNTYIDDFEVN